MESDLPRIVEIYNAAIPGRRSTADTDPVTVEARVEWLRDRDPARRPVWVLEHDDDIAAWISLQSFYGRPAYHETAEVSLYVDPRHHGKGFGALLMERMIASCPRMGVRTLLGFVFTHNEACIALNRKFGFRRWGLLPAVAEIDGARYDLAIDGLEIDG
ncbi:MAG: N-acetyltransferase family protein [Arenicellales bacterium]